MSSTVTLMAARSTPRTPTDGAWCSSATSSTADPTPPACYGWRWAWPRPETRCASAETTKTNWFARYAASHGLAENLEELAAQPKEFRETVKAFCDGLVAHYVFDGGRLVVAHAGLPEHYHRRASGAVRNFALYGDTTGGTDEYGLPVRYTWAEGYRGRAMVLYGHTPVPHTEWVNNTLCLDTGCVFGGALSALRYPECEIVSVAAHQVYYEPVKPLHSAQTARGTTPPGTATLTGDTARPPAGWPGRRHS